MLLYTIKHLIQILADKVQSIVGYGGLNLFTVYKKINSPPFHLFLGSIVVSIPACHAGDRGSIPRRGDFFFYPTKIMHDFRYNCVYLFITGFKFTMFYHIISFRERRNKYNCFIASL